MIELLPANGEPEIKLTITSWPNSQKTNVTGPLDQIPICLTLLAQGLGIVLQQIEKAGPSDVVFALRVMAGNLMGVANHLAVQEQKNAKKLVVDVGAINPDVLRQLRGT